MTVCRLVLRAQAADAHARLEVVNELHLAIDKRTLLLPLGNVSNTTGKASYLALLILSLLLTMSWSAARAADPSSLIPSTRWIFLDASPLVRSHQECSKLAKEFSEEIARINQQHTACLQGNPEEPAGNEGCSKESCQFLHTTRDKASKKASEQNHICTVRVNEYLTKERDEAQRKQNATDEAVRQKQVRAAALAKQDKEASEKAQERERGAAQQRVVQEKEDKERRNRDAQREVPRDKESQSGATPTAQKEAAEREVKRAQQEADLAARKLANVAVQSQPDLPSKLPGGAQNKPTPNPFSKLHRKGTSAGGASGNGDGTDGNGADRTINNPFDKSGSHASSSPTSASSGPGTDGVRKDLEKNVSPGTATATAANPFAKSASAPQEKPVNQTLIEQKATSAFGSLQRALSSEAAFRTEQQRVLETATIGKQGTAREKAEKIANHAVKMRGQYYDWVLAGGNTPNAIRAKDEKEILDSLSDPKSGLERIEAVNEFIEDAVKFRELISNAKWGELATTAGKKWLGTVISALDYSRTYSVESIHSYCDDKINECEAIRVRAEQNRGLMQTYRSEYQEFERSYYRELGGGDEVRGRVLAEQQQQRNDTAPNYRKP